MIANLEKVEGSRPFWRFSVLMEFSGEAAPIHGFMYRAGEGVIAPYMKFGRQGKRGKRTEVAGLNSRQLAAIQSAVEWAILPPLEQEGLRAAQLFKADSEACRKLYPAFYRDLFAARTQSPELFEELPERRLWPDEVLARWVELTEAGVRAPGEIVKDYENGVLSDADLQRIQEMVE